MKCGDSIKASEYRIEFLEACPKFSNSFLKHCIPENVCPLLLHTLVPYYFTYLYDGDFSWTKETGHVDVRCPNPKGTVVGDAEKGDPISFTIKWAEASCPFSYKNGIKINLTGIFGKLCPLAYDVAFAWIQLGIKNPIVLRCPGCSESSGLKFVLRRDNEN